VIGNQPDRHGDREQHDRDAGRRIGDRFGRDQPADRLGHQQHRAADEKADCPSAANGSALPWPKRARDRPASRRAAPRRN